MNDTVKFISRLWQNGNLGVFYHQNEHAKFPHSHWGEVAELEKMGAMLASKPATITDWFFAVNPLKEVPPTSKKGGENIRYIGSQKEYVQHANCFFLDFDNAESLPVSPIPPSAIVRSSENGYHYYYFLKEPFSDMERYYHMLSGFANSVAGADFAAATVERKLRVPTTFNCKSSYKKLYPQGYQIKIELLDFGVEYSICDFEKYEATGQELRSRKASALDESTSLDGFKLDDYNTNFLESYKQKIINDANLKLRYSNDGRKRAALFGVAQLLGANINIGLFTTDEAWGICADALKKNNSPVKDWSVAQAAFREGLAEVVGQKPMGFDSAHGQWIMSNLDFEEVNSDGVVVAQKSEKPVSVYVDNFSDFEYYSHGRWRKMLDAFDYETYNYVRWWKSLDDDESKSIDKHPPPPIHKAKIKRLRNSLNMGGVDYTSVNGKLIIRHESSPSDFIPVFNTRIDLMTEPLIDHFDFLSKLLGTAEQARQFIKAFGNTIVSEHPIVVGVGNNNVHRHGTDLHSTMLYIYGGSQTTGMISKTAKSFGFHNDYSEQSFRNLQFCRVVDVGPVLSLKSEDFIDIVGSRMIHGVDNFRGKSQKQYSNTQMYPKASIVFNTPANEMKQLDERLRQYLTYFPISDGDDLGMSPEQATQLIKSHGFAHWLAYHAVREKDYYGKLYHSPRVQTDEDRMADTFRDWFRIGESTATPKSVEQRVHNKDVEIFLTEAGFKVVSAGEIKKLIVDVYGKEYAKPKRDRNGAYYEMLRKRDFPETMT